MSERITHLGGTSRLAVSERMTHLGGTSRLAVSDDSPRGHITAGEEPLSRPLSPGLVHVNHARLIGILNLRLIPYTSTIMIKISRHCLLKGCVSADLFTILFRNQTHRDPPIKWRKQVLNLAFDFDEIIEFARKFFVTFKPRR